MRLVTWNVNSIKQRLPRLLALIRRHEPDVVCLQETKVEDQLFPTMELVAAGYECAMFGQRAYNGGRDPVSGAVSRTSARVRRRSDPRAVSGRFGADGRPPVSSASTW